MGNAVSYAVICVLLKDPIVSQLTSTRLLRVFEVPKRLYVFQRVGEFLTPSYKILLTDHAKCIAVAMMFLNRQFIYKMYFARSSSVMQDLVLMLMQRQQLLKIKL
jgi:hypothetical protein